MNWRDTVMSKEVISDAKKGHTAVIEAHPKVYPQDIAVANAQARITWNMAIEEERKKVIEIVNTPFGQVGNEVSTNSVALFRKFILRRLGIVGG